MRKAFGCAVLFLGLVTEAVAGATNSLAFVSINPVPTLDDLGLTVLTLVVAIAGGIAARRRKKK